MPRTSRFLFASLLTVYAALWLWYGGSGEPLSAEQSAAYVERLKEIRAQSAHVDTGTVEGFERLASQDDGREYYMVNLMKYRERALYPPGYAYDDDVAAAAARYDAAVVPELLRRGSLPILLADVVGRFLRYEGAEDWDRVAIVRYRSRRDMLEMAIALGEQDLSVHKWASLERTHVFPAQPVVDLVFVRGAVAVLLGLLGLGLHLVLRRRAAPGPA